MKLRRALPIAAVIPALLAISACSGESADSDGKKPSASAGANTKQSLEEKETAEAKLLGALDGKALEKAAITGKTAGFDAKKIAKAEVEAGRGMDADKKDCQPLASLIGGFTHLPAVSTVHRSLQPSKATNATVGSMWLASHSEDDATRAMKELRAAVTDCPKGFKTLGLTYGKVESLPAPKLGDEAVGYRITGDIGKQKVPMTYTVVRSGGIISAFYGVNMLDAKKAAIPEPVIKAQLKRLADAKG
ncbi:hypothetical protein [Streptomyces fulvorobeus]|uniref:Lipoprotein n=1 Tax=Streptomyces fulvorobeus TaxID=284028 RepID=A0A7J0CAR9_9ACTN|nr:hypothetical protein [Streptomyces fulvorobeus]NYE43049.1 hypothetical protein [Streptomyces fulvorobeus]GFM99488.1 hypothetical protein Sfulv_42990 [Streptomyces fulvorobeus]